MWTKKKGINSKLQDNIANSEKVINFLEDNQQYQTKNGKTSE